MENNPIVTCPHCECKLIASAITIQNDIPYCPSCEGSLCEEEFDAAAKPILRKRIISGRPVENCPDLKTLAHSRYYASNWYRQTGIQLDGYQYGDPVKIDYVYEKNASFPIAQLTANSEQRTGTAAEINVFETIRQKTTDPLSPLFGAIIIPGLYLHWRYRREDQSQEIDMVVLTQQAVFIIEVKTSDKHIDGRNKYESLMTQPMKGSWGLTYSQMLYKNENMYKMVVFDHPKSFKKARESFIGRKLVGFCHDERNSIIDPMEMVCLTNKNVVNRKDMEECASSLLERFGTKHLNNDGIIEASELQRYLRNRKIPDNYNDPKGRKLACSLMGAAIQNPESPLFGGKLISPALLPHIDRKKKQGKISLERQRIVDAIYLSDECAFIIKIIPDARKVVSQLEPTTECTIEYADGQCATFTPDKGVLLNNIICMKELSKLNRKLNADYIGKIILFVDPEEMSADRLSFKEDGRTLFAFLYQDGRNNLVSEMESKAATWRKRIVNPSKGASLDDYVAAMNFDPK